MLKYSEIQERRRKAIAAADAEMVAELREEIVARYGEEEAKKVDKYGIRYLTPEERYIPPQPSPKSLGPLSF